MNNKLQNKIIKLYLGIYHFYSLFLFYHTLSLETVKYEIMSLKAYLFPQKKKKNKSVHNINLIDEIH